MSAEASSVAYRSREVTPEEALQSDRRILLGFYHVRYDDGWQVMVPHTGWPGTVSAEPLDPEVPEHRAVIVAWADRCTRGSGG